MELKEKILGELHENMTKMEIPETDENLFKLHVQLNSQHVKRLIQSKTSHPNIHAKVFILTRTPESNSRSASLSTLLPTLQPLETITVGDSMQELPPVLELESLHPYHFRSMFASCSVYKGFQFS